MVPENLTRRKCWTDALFDTTAALAPKNLEYLR
jgi:hypothetical protein